jgi:hypothetical protein
VLAGFLFFRVLLVNLGLSGDDDLWALRTSFSLNVVSDLDWEQARVEARSHGFVGAVLFDEHWALWRLIMPVHMINELLMCQLTVTDLLLRLPFLLLLDLSLGEWSWVGHPFLVISLFLLFPFDGFRDLVILRVYLGVNRNLKPVCSRPSLDLCYFLEAFGLGGLLIFAVLQQLSFFLVALAAGVVGAVLKELFLAVLRDAVIAGCIFQQTLLVNQWLSVPHLLSGEFHPPKHLSFFEVCIELRHLGLLLGDVVGHDLASTEL